ncbi:alpha/beta hydrolase [Flavobacterium cerinum]|uniref:Alpha/beta hydrolase n=1 Tax=Flavobacterium cerinum TaxID=2502784 RepID=A0A3S3U3T2_9FLAO|nr:alpha/beta hydrolase-fold protein [Flavobacterium cerinum]RWX01524.1 alpha/beta hydrolase [Flavobacterium cerinum]
MKSVLTKLLLLLAVFNCFAQIKSKTVGIEGFKSKFVKARNIEIWLPPSYTKDPTKKFPVLYMQDGQNIFNPETSTHNAAWKADSTAKKMIADERIKPFIIVAIWNTDKRFIEYFPEKAAKNFSKKDLKVFEKIKQQEKIKDSELLGDEYLKFLVSELKPYIDKNYRTLSDPENTSICGSSMGALISLYAICEYPNIFGQAACMSTHWPLLFDNTYMPLSEGIKKYVFENLPPPSNHRIYFDHGTKSIDQYYEVHQKAIDNIMKIKGYNNSNWITKKIENAEHTEKAWQERFDEVLTFLYKGKKDFKKSQK